MDADSDSKWSLFGLTSPKLAACHLVGSKSAATARKILSGFRGKLVVDGFAIYPIVAEREKNIEIAHCWAHVDRKCKDAKDPPDRISEIRTLIHQLYEVEREVGGPFPGGGACSRDKAATSAREIAMYSQRHPEVVLCTRRSTSKRLRQSRALSAQALERAQGLRDRSARASRHAAADRALGGPVVGRKNFYGNRSKRRAEVAAIFYGVIETAKLNGIDPAAYLSRAAIAAIRSPGTATLPR